MDRAVRTSEAFSGKIFGLVIPLNFSDSDAKDAGT
jgi:hypothetical protein